MDVSSNQPPMLKIPVFLKVHSLFLFRNKEILWIIITLIQHRRGRNMQ